MDDLISRQEAIEAHYEYCNKHPDAGFPVWSLKILEDLPSAQPEHIKQTLDEVYAHAETEAEARFHAEIIACGDCKHWICHDRRCGYWNHGVRAIDWCSYAERRTDVDANT